MPNPPQHFKRKRQLKHLVVDDKAPWWRIPWVVVLEVDLALAFGRVEGHVSQDSIVGSSVFAAKKQKKSKHVPTLANWFWGPVTFKIIWPFHFQNMAIFAFKFRWSAFISPIWAGKWFWGVATGQFLYSWDAFLDLSSIWFWRGLSSISPRKSFRTFQRCFMKRYHQHPSSTLILEFWFGIRVLSSFKFCPELCWAQSKFVGILCLRCSLSHGERGSSSTTG